uniref:Reverse transcriptase n=1 Tax=Angiostrongylus cantonensis TaxID=6313 RepID=A0A0K0DC57_ANGCA
MNVDLFEQLRTRTGLCNCLHNDTTVITGDFIAKIGSRRTSEERYIGIYGLGRNEQASSNSQEEGVLANFDYACAKIGLRLNPIKRCLWETDTIRMFHTHNIINDLAPELSRENQAVWSPVKSMVKVYARNTDRTEDR